MLVGFGRLSRRLAEGCDSGFSHRARSRASVSPACCRQRRVSAESSRIPARRRASNSMGRVGPSIVRNSLFVVAEIPRANPCAMAATRGAALRRRQRLSSYRRPREPHRPFADAADRMCGGDLKAAPSAGIRRVAFPPSETIALPADNTGGDRAMVGAGRHDGRYEMGAVGAEFFPAPMIAVSERGLWHGAEGRPRCREEEAKTAHLQVAAEAAATLSSLSGGKAARRSRANSASPLPRSPR